jgi:hypothetical protein
MAPDNETHKQPLALQPTVHLYSKQSYAFASREESKRRKGASEVRAGRPHLEKSTKNENENRKSDLFIL